MTVRTANLSKAMEKAINEDRFVVATQSTIVGFADDARKTWLLYILGDDEDKVYIGLKMESMKEVLEQAQCLVAAGRAVFEQNAMEEGGGH